MTFQARRLWPAAMVLAACLATGMAQAQDAQRPLGVVELFTSQGCSSCPPADALLSELAQKANVIALAYHVDYWDYLGWKDALGSAENTERQRAYAKSLENASVYTPQAIVNGRRDMNGARRDSVLSAMNGMAETVDGLSVDLSIRDTGDSIVIDAGSLEGGGAVNAHVLLVDFAPRQTVAIRSGENRGRTLDYWNAVNRIHTVGMWNGAAKSYELPKNELVKEGNGCAVLLQVVDKKGRPGPILGAAKMQP